MKNMIRRTAQLTVLCTPLLVVGAKPAEACCGDGAVVTTGLASMGAAITAAIAASTTTLVTWLNNIDGTIAGGFAKVAGELMKQTAAMHENMKAQVVANSVPYMKEVEANAIEKYELSPRSCYEVAAAAGSAVAQQEVQTTRAELNRQAAARNLNTPNAAAAVQEIYQQHTDKYCSPQDVSLGRCQKPAAPELQNADVRADLMLNRTSLSQEQITASRALIANLANPIPTQMLPRGWERTQQGQQFVAGQLVEQARMSLADDSLHYMLAMRTPVKGLGAATMMNKPDVSKLDLLEAQVNGRFFEPRWQAQIQTFGTENLLREQAKMKALELWMLEEQFRQGERMEAMMATQLAMDVKRDSEARLAQARATAARAAAR